MLDYEKEAIGNRTSAILIIKSTTVQQNAKIQTKFDAQSATDMCAIKTIRIHPLSVLMETLIVARSNQHHNSRTMQRNHISHWLWSIGMSLLSSSSSPWFAMLFFSTHLLLFCTHFVHFYRAAIYDAATNSRRWRNEKWAASAVTMTSIVPFHCNCTHVHSTVYCSPSLFLLLSILHNLAVWLGRSTNCLIVYKWQQ